MVFFSFGFLLGGWTYDARVGRKRANRAAADQVGEAHQPEDAARDDQWWRGIRFHRRRTVWVDGEITEGNARAGAWDSAGVS